MIVPLFMDEVDIFLRTITGAVGDCSVTVARGGAKDLTGRVNNIFKGKGVIPNP